MMKVGIVTFHFVSNQGAVLQCYAMQQALKKRGYDSFVVDYRPRYHTVRYSAVKNPFRYARGFYLQSKKKGFLRCCYVTAYAFLRSIYYTVFGKDRATSRCFDEFIKKHLRLSKTFYSLKELQASPPEADALIAGSDQIWNPDILDQDFDGAYFLDFGNENVLRIAYAPSMGSIPKPALLAKMKDLAGKLTSISMREYHREVVEALQRDVDIVIDPTLLLDAEDYLAIEADNEPKEPYIFVYGFENTGSIQQAVDFAQKKYGCKVINGSPNRIKLQGNVENASAYAPDQFLNYIRNAECVVTNSFHGTVFSVIFQKKFVVVAHTTRGRRMTELLNKIGLEERIFSENHMVDLDEPIDYNAVDEKLKELRKYSFEYLDRALNKQKEGRV